MNFYSKTVEIIKEKSKVENNSQILKVIFEFLVQLFLYLFGLLILLVVSSLFYGSIFAIFYNSILIKLFALPLVSLGIWPCCGVGIFIGILVPIIKNA